MAIDIPLELDSGPIVWVKPELDASLLSAIERIGKLQDGSRGAEVTAVRTDLHKVAGAFELVGAEGLAVVVREFEAHFPDSPEIVRGESLNIVASACRRLIGHLQEIAAGAAPVPLRFLPEYLALGKLRGVAFGPADLFFPDLSRKPPKAAGVETVTPPNLPSYLLRQRREFQRGLLDWLRGNPEGTAIMENALKGIQAAYPLPAQRAFWWSSAALMSAIHSGAIESSSSIKQLFARIDLQIRRLVEGSTKVADRLKREVLYHIARATASNPDVDQVRELYELDTLVPRRVRREVDVVALRPAISALSETLSRCKDDWAAVSMNRSGATERLMKSVGELPAACAPIGIESLSELATGLAAAVPLISAKSLSEDTSLEFATALLLFETAIEHVAALPASFPTQVSNALKRLSYATSRAPIPDELRESETGTSLTRQAQERETVTQVCREIRANMRQVEGALDAVFRDATATEDLAQVPNALSQVSGALRMLGWNDAHGLLNEASNRLVALAESGHTADPKEIEVLANVLAGFGFYIDVRERRGAGAELIVDSLGRLLHANSDVAPIVQSEESVENALAARVRGLKASYQAYVVDPQNESQVALVRSALDDIARDGELIYDSELTKAAKTASMAMGERPINAAVLAAQLSLVFGETVEVPAISIETQKLLDTPTESHDSALLEIFTEEAREVVGNITSAHAEYITSAGNKVLLNDIRRGFHTIKGSGRMVGQVALGAAAWDVERVLNRAIEEERPANIHELELVRVATQHFDRWVADLENKKPASVPTNPFAALVATCDPTGEFSTVASAPTPTPTPTPTPAPTQGALATSAAVAVASPSPVAVSALAAASFATAAVAGATEALSPRRTDASASIPELDGLELIELSGVSTGMHIPDRSALPIEVLPAVAPKKPMSEFELAFENFLASPAAIATPPAPDAVSVPSYPTEEVSRPPIASDALTFAGTAFAGAAAFVVPAALGDKQELAHVPAVPEQEPESLFTAAAVDEVMRLTEEKPAAQDGHASLGLTDAELAELNALESAFAGAEAARYAAETPATAYSVSELDDEVEIEGVRINRTLFSIMSDEARTHLQTLDQELSLMLFDTSLLPSDTMIRAAHTLCGIHRTAGVKAVGNFAGLIEDSLIAIRHTRRPDDGLALLSDVVQSLSNAVLRIQARVPLNPAEKSEIARLSDRLEKFVEASGVRRSASDIEIAASLHDEVEPVIVEVPPSPSANAALISAEHTKTPVASAALAASALAVAVILEPQAPEAPKVSAIDAKGARPPSPLVPPPLEAILPLGTTEQRPPPAVVTPPESKLPSSPDVFVSPRTVALPVGLSSNAKSADTPIAAPIAAVSIAALTAAAIAARPFEPLATPASVPASAHEDPLLGIADDIDAQVLPIFLEEAQELFPAASGQLRAWRSNPQSQPELDGLKRNLHTLKGSARMAGAMRLGELTHLLETTIVEKQGEWKSGDLDRLEEQFDDIAFVLDALISGEHNVVLPRFVAAAETTETPLVAEAIAVATTTTAIPSRSVPADVVQTAVTGSEAPSLAARLIADSKASRVAIPQVAAPQLAAAPEGGVSYLRVRSDAVELLSDESGEIAINRSRIESELRGLKSGLIDLTSFVVRLRGQLREIEIQGESQIQSRLDQESDFDPLEFDRYTRFQELTRGLAEGVNDVATVQQTLLKNIADAETALAAQTRLSRSVQLRLQSLRTVPFSSVSERLYRVLRQTAKDVGKRANLEIVGGRIEMDRGVLERLVPVLEHLVRNSLAHGIETVTVREAAGKSGIGEINVGVRQQGNEVVIAFGDDGAGISAERVRAKAVSLGLLEANREVNDAQIVELIFRPGFSTADQVTATAGRGVGMDVVRSELASLGGRVVVATRAGAGSTFTLSVPLTLAVTQVLLLKVGGSTYGVPSSLIETVRQVPLAERNTARAAQQLQSGGKLIAYRSLASLLGTRSDVDEKQRSFAVAILRAGESALAIEIDTVLGNQEVVAKPYGPQLARVPGMAGLTVLGDGTITLLVDPIALASAQLASAQSNLREIAVIPASVVAEKPVTSAAPIGTALADEKLAADAPKPDVAHLAPAAKLTKADVVSKAPASDAPRAGAPASAPAPVVAPPVVAPPPPAVVARLPIVLVVDDSLTVRKITTRLLEREGYKALTAKDGLDALQVLSTVNPDVILLDIEMPRMDGFEFTKTIKADNRQNNIPIIMITSRTADKHRNHAMELGVNEYIGKPYQDDELMALVGRYTAHVERPS